MIGHHTLSSPSGARKKKRSIGRGDGSGRGSFSGRGCKGQSARSGGRVKPGFEGGQTPLIRRIPKLKGFKNINRISYQIINVASLNVFSDGESVDFVKLYESNLISSKIRPVKLLGDGAISKKIIIKIDACSASARQKVESAGGSISLPHKKVSETLRTYP